MVSRRQNGIAILQCYDALLSGPTLWRSRRFTSSLKVLQGLQTSIRCS